MGQILYFFSDLFSGVVGLFVFDGFRIFYFLGGCIIVGSVLSLVFHNRG